MIKIIPSTRPNFVGNLYFLNKEDHSIKMMTALLNIDKGFLLFNFFNDNFCLDYEIVELLDYIDPSNQILYQNVYQGEPVTLSLFSMQELEVNKDYIAYLTFDLDLIDGEQYKSYRVWGHLSNPKMNLKIHSTLFYLKNNK